MLFGQPGAGKTFVGKLLKKQVGFYFYDGDRSIPKSFWLALKNHEPISDIMREAFFIRLIRNVSRYQKKHQNIAVAQTFLKEKYRKLFLCSFPDAIFILITAETLIREKRLLTRKKPIMSLSYWQKMASLFEPPKIAHSKLVNNRKGEEEILHQLMQTFKPYRKDN